MTEEKTNKIAEDYVITLSNEGRYYLVHELSDYAEDGSRYFSAIGVNNDDTFDLEDTIFLQNYERDGQQIFKKVNEDSSLYKELAVYETAITAMESIPGYAKKLEEELAKSSE